MMSPLERESHLIRRVKFEHLLLHCSNEEEEDQEEGYSSRRQSSASDQTTTTNSNDEDDATSSLVFSPWSQASSYMKSPWSNLSPPPMARQVTRTRARNNCGVALMGSLLREDGHVYSLAVRDGTLYTGSNGKNIRIWKNFRDGGGFKSASGFVKAIVVAKDGRRVYTGHRDGKVRVWTRNGKRVGTLPKLKDFLKCSMNPNNYVEVRRRRKVPKIRHYDAVSCLALNEEAGLLYSGSWDKTIKVWRLNDFKCIESINAHDDAINAVVVGFGGVVFSGSADGTLKVWRREMVARGRHVQVRTLLEGHHAVTSLAVAGDGGGGGGGGGVLYSGASDGLVRFWEEEEEMAYRGVLRGHKMAVLCLATAGRLVISGSADQSVCIWRREGGLHSCLAVLTGHCGPVKCLAVEQDHYDDHDHDDCDDDGDDNKGRRWIVYSGSLDKSVRIWRVEQHAPDHDR